MTPIIEYILNTEERIPKLLSSIDYLKLEQVWRFRFIFVANRAKIFFFSKIFKLCLKPNIFWSTSKTVSRFITVWSESIRSWINKIDLFSFSQVEMKLFSCSFHRILCSTFDKETTFNLQILFNIYKRFPVGKIFFIRKKNSNDYWGNGNSKKISSNCFRHENLFKQTDSSRNSVSIFWKYLFLLNVNLVNTLDWAQRKMIVWRQKTVTWV